MDCLLYFCIMSFFQYFKNPRFLLTFTIACAYCLLAIFMYLYKDLLAQPYRGIFAIAIVVYAFFRLYRAYRDVRDENENEAQS